MASLPPCVCSVYVCVALFRKSKSAIKVLRTESEWNIDDDFMPHSRIIWKQIHSEHPTRCTHFEIELASILVQCSRWSWCLGVESSKHLHLPCTFSLAHMVSEFQFGIDWTGHLTSKRKCTGKKKRRKRNECKKEQHQPRMKQERKEHNENNKSDKMAQRTK